MTWPSRIYCATKTLGVYYTSNFSSPSVQPTWAAKNDGLPATDVRQFALDPFDPLDKQYLLLETARTLYRRDNQGSWASILTSAQADTLCSGSSGYISHFCLDETAEGRIWALYGGNGGDGVVIFALYSDDYGANWTAATRVTTSGVSERTPQGIAAAGDVVFIQFVRGDGNRYVRSTNNGSTWYETAYGSSSRVALTLNPLQPTRAYSCNDAGLLLYTTTADVTLLNNAVWFSRTDAMWFSDSTAAHHRIIDGGKLYVTTDSWGTANSPSAITPVPLSIAPWAGDDEDNILVSLTLDTNPTGGLQPHVIGCLVGEDDTTAVGIAGSYCDTSPYTDSIPMTCGGAAVGGIAAVEAVDSPQATYVRLLSIHRNSDMSEYISRIYPRGNSGMTLANCSRTAPSGYTLNTVAGYISSDTAETSHGRREAAQYFDISVPNLQSESAQLVFGSNALYDAAIKYLQEHDSIPLYYTATVTGFSGAIRPGQTLRLLSTTTVDGDDVIVLDEDTSFNIISVKTSIDQGGIPIAEIELSTAERAPQTDARITADAVVYARRAISNTSNGSGTTVNNIISADISGLDARLTALEDGHSHSGNTNDGGQFDAANLLSGTATPSGYMLTAGGSATVSWAALADHDHSGDAGDGGAFELTHLTSGTATSGYVPTADGSAGISWAAPSGGAALTLEEADGTPSVANVSKIVVTNGTLTDSGGGTATLDFGSAATDGNAIHDNVASEIHAITEKTTPADADEIIIEDSADSYNKKRVQISNLPAGGGGGAYYLDNAGEANPNYTLYASKGSITATASHNAGALSNALDAKYDSLQYSSNASQSDGMYVSFDMGTAVTLKGISQVCTAGDHYSTDYPRAWEILASTTGSFTGEQGTLALGSASAAGVINTLFSPAEYRYWRIELTTAAGNYWRVNEFDFFINLELAVSGLQYGQKVTTKNSSDTILDALTVDTLGQSHVLLSHGTVAKIYITAPNGSTDIYSDESFSYTAGDVVGLIWR